jgi:hypothetical protein
MTINGLEIIPERLKRVRVVRPYYLYTIDWFVNRLLRSGDLNEFMIRRGRGTMRWLSFMSFSFQGDAA